jgi:hypothetical protein
MQTVITPAIAAVSDIVPISGPHVTHLRQLAENFDGLARLDADILALLLKEITQRMNEWTSSDGDAHKTPTGSPEKLQVTDLEEFVDVREDVIKGAFNAETIKSRPRRSDATESTSVHDVTPVPQNLDAALRAPGSKSGSSAATPDPMELPDKHARTPTADFLYNRWRTKWLASKLESALQFK